MHLISIVIDCRPDSLRERLEILVERLDRGHQSTRRDLANKAVQTRWFKQGGSNKVVQTRWVKAKKKK